MRSLSPITIILLSFISLIVIGSSILLLPGMTFKPLSVVDALFTATSAVCVTGLIVLDTATDFTLAGQLVILALIQLGGLGVMTFSIGLISVVSKRLEVRWQFAFMNLYGRAKRLPVRHILSHTILFTLGFEFVVALLLFIRFSQDFPIKKALYYSLFHAISSFCNAGFSTFSNSMTLYAYDYYMMVVLSLSLIAGGIGFLVIAEVSQESLRYRRGVFRQLSLHAKVVLSMSIFLLLGGTLFFFVSEWNGVLIGRSIADKLIVSFFQSASCRTAGFNSVDLALLKDNTLFMMCGLMIVGGSPGSIAGGIKTTTLWVICAIIIGKFRNQQQLVAWNRGLSKATVEQSTTLFILALLFVSVTTLLISSFDILPENIPFIHKLFEMASAFGTVGLSANITAKLSPLGRIVVSCVMLVGRLGPLSFLAALTEYSRPSDIRYPEEHIMIG